jgi:hypothetical protein
VVSVGATLTGAPLEGENSLLRIEAVGRTGENSLVGSWRVVTRGYFSVFNIPLIRGRLFTETDVAGNEPVVIINRSLSARLWPGGDPLNDRLLLGGGAGPDFADVARRIVGVVGDTRQAGLERAPLPAAYVPISQLPDAEMAFFNRLSVPTTWVVRVDGNPLRMAAPLRETLRKTTAAAITPARTMDDVMRLSIAQRRFEMLVMAVFALAALVLSALGVYGACAYSVHQRVREIGIRMTLGARATDVRAMVFKEGLILAVLGLSVGMLIAFVAVRVVQAFLYGVTPRDPVVFSVVALVVGSVVLLAVWFPAERAARTDPSIALRAE